MIMQYFTGNNPAAVVYPGTTTPIAAPGRLLGVYIQGAVSSASIVIYDSPVTTASAALTLFTTVAVTAIGTFYQIGPPGVGIPFYNGLWVAANVNTGAFSVIASANCPNDGRPAT